MRLIYADKDDTPEQISHSRTNKYYSTNFQTKVKLTLVKTFSRFPVPDLNDLLDDINERIIEVQEKLRFVRNVFLVLT